MQTIFVQDSDHDILETLSIIMESTNHKLHTFLNCGEDFMNSIRIIKPDLVLMEYIGNGVYSTRSLSKLKLLNANVPVIAFTTNSFHPEKYKNLGFTDYLLKPFDLDVLFGTIDKHLNPTQYSTVS